MKVVLEGLGHQFPGQPFLFQNLTAELHPDHVYALVGPSGSGKSTLLSLIAGWLTPTSGAVVRQGVERVSWVFQNPLGVAGRTAVDHVALPFLVRGASRAEATRSATTLLEEFELTHVGPRPFAALSGGEAQRLMLARGIASRPDLFLVDEPTAQLDTRTAATVNRTLGALAARDMIVVIATHDPHTREACTDVVDLTEFA